MRGEKCVGKQVKKKKENKSIVKKKKNSTNKNKPQKKTLKNRRKILAVVSIIIILFIIIVLILSLDIFNIKKITVKNNNKISSEEIIKNSQLTVGNNMFKTWSSVSKEGIKTNPYIENVKINKKLNGEIIIEVEERSTTYMLQLENSYAYINNQGYILEISKNPLQLPIIKGYSSTNLSAGNRMNVEDLEKLEIVIQIMEAAKSNNIKDLIESIDISNANNFILEIPSEGKTVQFGDASNINVKILWIVDLITREKRNRRGNHIKCTKYKKSIF